MKITPANTPQMGEDEVQALVLAKRNLLNIPPADPVLVVAIRGYYLNSMGQHGKNDYGIYDDAFFVLAPNHFSSYNGNTDPSRRRRGVACLVADQLIKYKPGYHGYGRKSGHPAFRQASPAIVYREGEVGNGKPLGNGLFTDEGTNRFWCNNHKGGRYSTNSAGCLTIPPEQWNAYHSTVTLLLKRHQAKTFNLVLLEDERIRTRLA